jgi:hypothetical protein
MARPASNFRKAKPLAANIDLAEAEKPWEASAGGAFPKDGALRRGAREDELGDELENEAEEEIERGPGQDLEQIEDEGGLGLDFGFDDEEKWLEELKNWQEASGDYLDDEDDDESFQDGGPFQGEDGDEAFQDGEDEEDGEDDDDEDEDEGEEDEDDEVDDEDEEDDDDEDEDGEDGDEDGVDEDDDGHDEDGEDGEDGKAVDE